MSQAVCVKCGANCCKCSGCRPELFKDGLCPKCQVNA